MVSSAIATTSNSKAQLTKNKQHRDENPGVQRLCFCPLSVGAQLRVTELRHNCVSENHKQLLRGFLVDNRLRQ